MAPAREVEYAKVMLGYADGISITELQRRLGFSRPMIYRCVDKALAAGFQMGLKDKYHRPNEPEISEEAKAWVAIRTMSEHLMEDCRRQADAWMQGGGAKPRSLVGAAVIVLVWVAVAGGLWVWWAP